MTIEEKIRQVDQLKHELDILLPMTIENEKRWWKKVRLDWNYDSNHIEGNTLTYSETELLLIFSKVSGTHDDREIEEMKAHDVAIHMVKEWADDKSRDITESDIRELNKIILVKAFWKNAITPDGQETKRLIKVGEYKEQPNSVRLQNGEIFDYASPIETPALMKDLMDFYLLHSQSKEIHPLWLAAMMHYKFVRIHPFDDGNGRVARLIMNYVLMKNNFPPVIIKSSRKKDYLDALNQADVGNDEFFQNYIGEQLVQSLELEIKAAKGESIEEPDDVEKEISIWKKEVLLKKREVVEKSFEVIENLYQTSLRKFMMEFIDKMKTFKDVFNSIDVRGWFNGSNYENEGVESIEHGFNQRRVELMNNLMGGTNHVLQTEIKIIYLDITFKGFSGRSKTIFNHSLSLIIEFEQYIYRLKIDEKVVKEKEYSQKLTDQEIQEILNSTQKQILLELQKKSGIK